MAGIPMLILRSLMPTDDSARVTSSWSAFDAICRGAEGIKGDQRGHQYAGDKTYQKGDETYQTTKVLSMVRIYYCITESQ